jgi:hypothetical protein
MHICVGVRIYSSVHIERGGGRRERERSRWRERDLPLPW